MDRLIELQKSSKKLLLDKFGTLPLNELSEFELQKGKYKGYKYSIVVEKDPDYCDWIMKNVKSKLSPLALFKHYLERKMTIMTNIDEVSKDTHKINE